MLVSSSHNYGNGGPDDKQEQQQQQQQGDEKEESKDKEEMDTSASVDEKEQERKKSREEATDPDDVQETPELASDQFVSPPEDENAIILDRFNSDLHFDISANGLGGCGRNEGGFMFLWAGARAVWGVKGGKYAYECKIEENLEVELSQLDLPEEQAHPHACRIGFSKDGSDLTVGEDAQSYAYGSTAKAITNKTFMDYGESYESGDVIECCISVLDCSWNILWISGSFHYFYADQCKTNEEDEDILTLSTCMLIELIV